MSTFKCLVLSLVTNRTLSQSKPITTVETQELLSAQPCPQRNTVSALDCVAKLYKLSAITGVIIVYNTDSIKIIFIEKAFLKLFTFSFFWVCRKVAG